MSKETYGFLTDLALEYDYTPPRELRDWWWETYYRGRRKPWAWSPEIANAVANERNIETLS